MLLGVDFGKSKVGLAVAEDRKNAVAIPLQVIRYDNLKNLLEIILKVVSEYQINRIILGNPYQANVKDENKKDFIEFVKKLKETVKKDLVITSEYLTTREAMRYKKDLPKSRHISDDAIAAKLILQFYIDQKN